MQGLSRQPNMCNSPNIERQFWSGETGLARIVHAEDVHAEEEAPEPKSCSQATRAARA